MADVLVAGPWIGDQDGGYSECVVFTGGGRNQMYRFAKVKKLVNIPDHESECMGWRVKREDFINDYNKLIQQVIDRARSEYGDSLDFFSLKNLERLNYPYYERGRPDLWYSNSTLDSLLKKFDIRNYDKGKRTVVLCVRDRAMSEFRNWDMNCWNDLVDAMVPDYNVIMLGKVRPESRIENGEAINLLNRTTIDDCIDVFGNTGPLAVGGSTGMLHIASRCGTDHLVWGGELNEIRYAETNWFGCKHKVFTEWGWDPEPEQVLEAIENYFDTGVFE